MNEILSYHGTLESDGKTIISGGIKVNSGGGELGQGFYLGDMAHEAFAWAKKRGARHKKPHAVVKFEMTEVDFFSFDILSIDRDIALYWKREIKYIGAPQTYNFGVDVVWSPIVGGNIEDANQYKWESPSAEVYLNGSSVLRSKV
ncbi:hypothetical protein ACEZN7_003176 [Vibrio parahaemolyticus]|nr:hypothetical protein [Vibrio parahaemolyticus]EQM04350.1 hypothetical protein D019_2385 [Vibrio parahaemolyticus VP2007-095]ANQ55800.1 hypothetical protein AB831_06305 [Vibrio parahaemolyticus]ASO15656.1 hypothetical protein BGM07_015390 [Vibrio parahaemolyticus]EGQ7723877.1 hypothetical protein [Vibrio parahaemolyticus]EGQ7733764.1 hypothetical protein [Vibrio parahaemolyticus]